MGGANRAPRIAVIGGGKFGEMHLRTFTQLQRDGKAALVALCDINEELLAQRHEQYGVKGYTDYRAMLEHEDIDGVTVVVSSKDIAHPTAVRYGWANTPDVDLYNKEGLPASPFRTDRPGPK